MTFGPLGWISARLRVDHQRIFAIATIATRHTIVGGGGGTMVGVAADFDAVGFVVEQIVQRFHLEKLREPLCAIVILTCANSAAAVRSAARIVVNHCKLSGRERQLNMSRIKRT